jgi:hypothetical protein
MKAIIMQNIKKEQIKRKQQIVYLVFNYLSLKAPFSSG